MLKKPSNAHPLELPVAFPLWMLCNFRISREELHSILGCPAYTETDTYATFGGEEDAWAYQLPSGQRVLVILNVALRQARFCADPPDLEPVLAAFGLVRDQPDLDCSDEPCLMR
jgi:hypothetical protein